MTGKIITRDQIKDGRMYEVTITGVGVSPKCIKTKTIALDITLNDPSCVIRDVTPPDPIKIGDIVRFNDGTHHYEVLKIIEGTHQAVLFAMSDTFNWTTTSGSLNSLKRVEDLDD